VVKRHKTKENRQDQI